MILYLPAYKQNYDQQSNIIIRARIDPPLKRVLFHAQAVLEQFGHLMPENDELWPHNMKSTDNYMISKGIQTGHICALIYEDKPSARCVVPCGEETMEPHIHRERKIGAEPGVVTVDNGTRMLITPDRVWFEIHGLPLESFINSSGLWINALKHAEPDLDDLFI